MAVSPLKRLVVVGFAEAASAPEVVWSLVDAGHPVIAFARKGRSSALRRSRHVTCVAISPPESDADAATGDLQSLLATTGEASPLLFPLDDTAVWLSSQNGIPHSARIVGPIGHEAELALDKERQVQAARRAGFDVPETTVALTARDLKAAARQFPVMLKPARCVELDGPGLRRGRYWIVAGPTELARAAVHWAERGPLLVQPYIEGVGEGIFGLAAPEGVRAWSGHRRLRMMNPHGSGSSACVSLEIDAGLKRAATTLIEQTGWRGLFMIELLRDATGRVWFVELNGRPWGSMALSRRQGLEYPAWQVALTLDEGSVAVRIERQRPGLVCRHVGRELMHLLFVLRGPRSTALRRWPSLWSAFRDVLSIRPGDAVYNWRRDDPLVFINDCYHAVHDNVFKRGH